MKRFKIVLLFLFVLCVFSFVLFYLRIAHVSRQNNYALNMAKDFLECFDKEEKHEGVIDVNGVIGIIKIPKLGIEAPILNGTDNEILKFSVRAFCRYIGLESEMLFLRLIMRAHMLIIFQILIVWKMVMKLYIVHVWERGGIWFVRILLLMILM